MALTLAQIDTAIADVLEIGQTVTHDGTTFNMADLAKLQDLRNEVASEDARGSTRPTFRAFNFGTMGY